MKLASSLAAWVTEQARKLVPYQCSCQRVYTWREWRRNTVLVNEYELRDCESCHSTRSLRVERQTEIEPSAEGRAGLVGRLVSDQEPMMSHERDVR